MKTIGYYIDKPAELIADLKTSNPNMTPAELKENIKLARACAEYCAIVEQAQKAIDAKRNQH